MLAFLLAWLLLVAVCVPPGVWLLQLLRADCFKRTADRFVLAVWLGLALLLSAALGLSLFVRLSPIAGAVLGLAFAVPPLLLSRGVRGELAGIVRVVSAPVAAGLAVAAVGVALLTTQQVWYFDTGLYHYGFIKWLGSFGAVPGVALVHYRFAVATSWFALSAFFDAGPLAGRMSAVLGGFALLLSLVHLAAALARWAAGRASLADRLLAVSSGLCMALVVYGMMPKPYYLQAAISPSPDFPVNVLIILIAWSIVVVLESGKEKEGRLLDASLVPLVLASGALTIRISALPLAAVAGLFYALRGGAVVKRLIVGGAVVATFMTAVVGYQFVASGCPLFPVPLCLDVPWSVGADEARHFIVAVRHYGRWLGVDHDSADRFGWIGPWFVLGLTRVDWLLLVASGAGAAAFALLDRIGVARVWRRAAWVCGAVFVLMLAFRAQNIFLLAVPVAALVAGFRVARGTRGVAWPLALGLAGSFLTLYSGPSLRFGLGYVSVLFACLTLLIKEGAWRVPRLSRVRPRTIFAALLMAFGAGVNTERALNSISTHAARALGRASAAAPAPAEEQPASAAPVTPASPVAADGAVGLRSQLLVPPPIFAGIVVRRHVNNLDYFRAGKSEQCWGSELPCAPVDLPPNVMLRDPSKGLAAGFVNTDR